MLPVWNEYIYTTACYMIQRVYMNILKDERGQAHWLYT